MASPMCCTSMEAIHPGEYNILFQIQCLLQCSDWHSCVLFGWYLFEILTRKLAFLQKKFKVFFAFFLHILVLRLKRNTNHFLPHSHHFILSSHRSIAHLTLHKFTLIRNEPENILFQNNAHMSAGGVSRLYSGLYSLHNIHLGFLFGAIILKSSLAVP